MSVQMSDPAPTKTYFTRLRQGVIPYQRCADCAMALFYPRILCPSCGSSHLAWQDSTGIGIVYSLTAIPTRNGDPYLVCLVDLDDGYRMMSTVVDVPALEVTIGMRVYGSVDHDGDEPRVVFRATAS
jgi:uncharacterized OB-fold protein